MDQGRDDFDVPLRPPHRTARQRATRQSIGAFSRAVGLSASALRQYGDSGLLAPAEIEERTGYRYYAPDQQQRAIWIRRLRDAGLGLSRIRTILDGDAAEAEAQLDGWLNDAEDRHSSATALVDDLKLSLRARAEANPVQRTTARFDGAVLAAAVQQVSAASAPDDAGHPGFAAVLIELDSAGAEVVATDRYLLMARLSVASTVTGPGARVSIHADAAADWLRVRATVDLVIEAPTGRDGVATTRAELRDDNGGSLVLECLPDLFPSVRELVPDDSDATRVVLLRDDVLRLASGAQSVALSAADGRAVLRSAVGSATGSSAGRAAAVELSADMLARIGTAGVRQWLTCDIREPDQAVIWRTPSQPDFIALIMPRDIG
ncbi:MerR family transcriptional regulator [Microbacterium sp. H1-D42]|uniref:MerR family transcriptional regulator n=1 Tax=Microbacterium sp. H1-D42 TaxID=2925844 RepID=UPI001F539414|nr:MerR family transcriptional regulator [Microbacterium sp. H1-D42]UNK70295.1 MerR family transcriptional regulator [Microbacterium sp. H1-D42]